MAGRWTIGLGKPRDQESECQCYERDVVDPDTNSVVGWACTTTLADFVLLEFLLCNLLSWGPTLLHVPYATHLWV